jgi:uncharacterized membrane protein YozB (DUF420 family)
MKEIWRFLHRVVLTIGSIVVAYMIFLFFIFLLLILDTTSYEPGGLLNFGRSIIFYHPALAIVLLVIALYSIIYLGWVKKI